MNDHPLLSSLHGGKRWSTDRAQLAAETVLREPELFELLFKGLTLEEPLARMRVAYAVSKVALERPDLLQPYKERFLDRLLDPDNSHLARACMLQAMRTLTLDKEDIELLVDTLKDFLFSESSIVKTLSLQLLADFAAKDEGLRKDVLPLLWAARESGTPAMRARARKLLKRYHL
ncbi:hypothetical protein LJC59_07325 [Desulfovibrio sp. OttesenSCG-928-A18]|nr:hypothetical protein [Desulfovibrio sp. OttesenSCG-928-A18]